MKREEASIFSSVCHPQQISCCVLSLVLVRNAH